MGTRCDFYVGRGTEAEWLGSIAWDGNPGSVFSEASELFDGEPALTEREWREWVSDFLAAEDSATTPDMGWPWPWEDSRTTDYAHAWEDGHIYSSSYGTAWFRVDPEADCYGELDTDDRVKVAVFPDMTERKAVTFGPRSGLLIFGGPA